MLNQGLGRDIGSELISTNVNAFPRRPWNFHPNKRLENTDYQCDDTLNGMVCSKLTWFQKLTSTLRNIIPNQIWYLLINRSDQATSISGSPKN